MSLPESIKDELQAFKPFLKYQLGDVVFLVTDEKKEWPMMICGFDTNEDYPTDYFCTWLNAKGEKETESYPEECLILNK